MLGPDVDISKKPRAADKAKDRSSFGTIKALSRGLELLEAISDAGGKMRLTPLAKHMGLHLSTVHHLVKTLHQLGYLLRDENHEYRLSGRVFKLAEVAWHADRLGHLAVGPLSELALKTHETTHLAIFDRSDAIIVMSKFEGTGSSSLVERVGAVRPFYCTALGKVLLAHQPEVVQEHYLTITPLKPVSPKTVTAEAVIREELRRARLQGYAIDDEEFTLATRCIAAPVFNYSGTAIAAIAVAGNIWNVTDERMPALIKATCDMAARISADLGYDITERLAAPSLVPAPPGVARLAARDRRN
jgi:DNA-binding IclR family transcriptional regulator